MIYAIFGCLIIIGFLVYKLYQKQRIDKSELEKYNNDLLNTKAEKKILDEQLSYERQKLNECRQDIETALDTYKDITETRLGELNTQIEEQRQKRQEDLNKVIEAKQKDVDNEISRLDEILKNTKTETEYEAAQYWYKVHLEKQKYESLLEPIKQYEKEKQERLFYTIQLPEEYQEDIEFLLTTVASKVQHPDIISKLVWTEYVKPNLDNTFKRIEIKTEPGIYKLTSLENGMAYIGKSTDVKKRIADHFKSSIGIKSIADQAVHHAILKEGFWNWTIEIITYADKEQLNELEKYYIEFFKTQEYGYNKNSGGGG